MTTNIAAASVVGAVVLLVALVGHLPPVVAFVAIFKLNALTTFMNPARASLMPSIVGRDLLTTAQGLFSTARETAALAGSATAGLVIAAAGAVWALVVDAASFAFVALCIAIARLPGRAAPPSASTEARPRLSPLSVARDLREGWRTASGLPVVWALLWLGVLINIASFIGPLWPALVQQRLGGGAGAYGVLLAASTAGGIVGGLAAGPLERRLGAGRILASGWSLAGICGLGIAASTWLPATMALEFVETASFVASMVASGRNHDHFRTRGVPRQGLRDGPQPLRRPPARKRPNRRLDRGVRGDMDHVRRRRGLHPCPSAPHVGHPQCPQRPHLGDEDCRLPKGRRPSPNRRLIPFRFECVVN